MAFTHKPGSKLHIRQLQGLMNPSSIDEGAFPFNVSPLRKRDDEDLKKSINFIDLPSSYSSFFSKFSADVVNETNAMKAEMELMASKRSRGRFATNKVNQRLQIKS